jgi:xanthine dehydrogenase YagR molybdenum-binding subunit
MTEFTMDEALGETRLDAGAQGVIGKPLDRKDGPLKVSGRARYAYEALDVGETLYGVVAVSGGPRGRLTSVDVAAAEAAPGVLAVLSGPDLPRASAQPMSDGPKTNAGDAAHYNQPVALVVAETFEQARHAATLVRSTVETETIDHLLGAPETLFDGAGEEKLRKESGDFDAAFAAAPIKIDATYTTASHHAAAMEPHAATARWDGDDLLVWGTGQLVDSNTRQIAAGVGVPVERVRLLSPYVGGGFGSKLGIGPEAILAAMAAKRLGRAVKVALSRRDVLQTTSRRTESVQRVRLGAETDGRLTALAHECWMANAPDESFAEPTAISTRFLYAAPNRRITHRLVHTGALMTSAVRAPGEAIGMLALEAAMDELAEAAGVDPLELRKRNEPDRDPEEGLPFSSRMLTECIDEGARRFGWADRPKNLREGDWLIGTGFAAASRKNLLVESAAEVTLRPDGSALVRTSMTDIGTGTYTILAQIAGEMLGLPVEAVTVDLGDSAAPHSAGSGGSQGANSSGSGVYVACEAVIAQLAERLDAEPEALTLKDGAAIVDNRRIPLAEILSDGPIIEKGVFKPGAAFSETHQAGYGAHFCEAAVNAVTGEVRVRRLLTVAAAGRILNEKTARSQCYGGQIWGLGESLMESLDIDPRTGQIVNPDLAEYHVPVNADAPALEVVFLDELDRAAGALAGKGIGELALSGVGAAIANAVHDACGVRVRDFPITLDKVLSGMEAAEAA